MPPKQLGKADLSDAKTGTARYAIVGDECLAPPSDPPRCVHYIGFRDDRYWNAFRIWGGPRIIHRRWDKRALRDIGPNDVVIFAEGDDMQEPSPWNTDDLDERLL